MLLNYGPANWDLMLQSPSAAYAWVCPPLMALDEIYAEGTSQLWMDQQVMAIFLSSSSKDSSQARASIQSFVMNFTRAAGRLRLAELMLFFARYRAGVYDRSFAAFDPRRIGQTFHQEFLPERARELADFESKAAARRSVEDARLRRLHCISREAFDATAPDRRFGLRLRPLLPLDSSLFAELWQRLEVERPTPLPEVDEVIVLVRRRDFPLLVFCESKGYLRVVDSWLPTESAKANANA